jgi:hypothetical protein
MSLDISLVEPGLVELFSSNITHNLHAMAEEAGIYRYLWYPEEAGITKASDLVEPLKKALQVMRADPERFKKHDPPNKWGTYDRFLPWLEKYICACEEHPDAIVQVSR